ncbi:BA14K family protein [Rhizobium rhizosphaerae]|nr:BA14K family protein [Xaviernesmea rhizosphaerae]
MGVFKMKILPLALSALFVATSFQPSFAFTPVPTPAPAAATAPVDLVQYREDWRRDRDWRRHHRGWDRRADGYRRGNGYYYNGHRGYRERRPGYRYHNGLWFPLAAFATGAIIGGATAAPRAAYGNSHVQWCMNRYRSYRASDNTYQPNNGPRRQCVSP